MNKSSSTHFEMTEFGIHGIVEAAMKRKKKEEPKMMRGKPDQSSHNRLNEKLLEGHESCQVNKSISFWLLIKVRLKTDSHQETLKGKLLYL